MVIKAILFVRCLKKCLTDINVYKLFPSAINAQISVDPLFCIIFSEFMLMFFS